ncbi:MAG: hypothetical protein V9H26_02040 [Verrucomicrobiota bacterium]
MGALLRLPAGSFSTRASPSTPNNFPAARAITSPISRIPAPDSALKSSPAGPTRLPGYYRIGIANGANIVTGEVASDLATNTTYQIVSRYNVGTGESFVWVNPASSASAGVSATDATSTLTIAQYGLRQDSSVGTLYLDNLKIGTSLDEVVTLLPPVAQTLTNSVINGELILSWANPLFVLQSAPEVTGPYTTIPDATSPYTNTLSGGQQYFRLKY